MARAKKPVVSQDERDWTLIVAAVRGDLYDKLPSDAAKNEMLNATWKESDGFGPNADIPWDWSGIRDSSKPAKRAMAAVAERVLRRYRLMPTEDVLAARTVARLEEIAKRERDFPELREMREMLDKSEAPGPGAVVLRTAKNLPADADQEFCVAGKGFVSPTFRGREAADEFAEQLRQAGGLADVRVVPAAEGRALKRAMVNGKES
jgi:hypothetical protein